MSHLTEQLYELGRLLEITKSNGIGEALGRVQFLVDREEWYDKAKAEETAFYAALDRIQDIVRGMIHTEDEAREIGVQLITASHAFGEMRMKLAADSAILRPEPHRSAP